MRTEEETDGIDEKLKEEHRVAFFWFLVLFALTAALMGVWSWLSGSALQAYEREAGSMFVAYAVVWLLSCAHSEFRTRMNATHRTVAGLQETLGAIQEKLGRESESAVTVSRIEWAVNELRKDLERIEESVSEIRETA